MEFDFEKGMKRLSEISEQMNGDIPLEMSIKLYSEAAELVKKCREYIDSAKLAVEQTEMK
ncbi:MAG: exodeoxyribonuclease VII small subunit [Oscillospiraceae bacterium]|nr:exodeoxyribonuclease VII small subunit [Oscillospiraceae bacterium]